jgi:hypothetical protein
MKQRPNEILLPCPPPPPTHTPKIKHRQDAGQVISEEQNNNNIHNTKNTKRTLQNIM